jgi:hypothetical protein
MTKEQNESSFDNLLDMRLEQISRDRVMGNTGVPTGQNETIVEGFFDDRPGEERLCVEEAPKKLVRSVPGMVRDMWDRGLDVYVGSSFPRLLVRQDEEVRDVDLYCGLGTQDRIIRQHGRGRANVHSVTIGEDEAGRSINLVTAFDCRSALDYIEQVDLTISAAAMHVVDDKIVVSSMPSWRQHVDLRRLHYCKPDDLDASGTLPRVLKMYARGYTMSGRELAKVVVGLMRSTKHEDGTKFVSTDHLVRELTRVLGNTECVEEGTGVS